MPNSPISAHAISLSSNPPPAATPARVAELRRQIEGLQTAAHARPEALLSTGYAPLDRLLPGGGLGRGVLVEWLSSGPGSGAATLALQMARRALREHEFLWVIDSQRMFYPPAAAALGFDPQATFVVRPRPGQETFWTCDQVLRCPGAGVVLAWLEAIDSYTFRRLQLAAETGGGLGLLLRPGQVRGAPSWAEASWWIEPLASPRQTSIVPGAGPPAPRRWHVELLRCRGARAGQSITLEESSAEAQNAMSSDERRLPVRRSVGHVAANALPSASPVASATAAARRVRA